MSMSDCEKCWDTPCTCGHEYRGMRSEDRLRIAQAALPEGYAIVPVVPTEAMVEVLWSTWTSVEAQYLAILVAAPKVDP